MHPNPSPLLEMLHKPRTPYHAVKFGNPIPNPPTAVRQPEKKKKNHLFTQNRCIHGPSGTKLHQDLQGEVCHPGLQSCPLRTESPPAPRCRWDPGSWPEWGDQHPPQLTQSRPFQ